MIQMFRIVYIRKYMIHECLKILTKFCLPAAKLISGGRVVGRVAWDWGMDTSAPPSPPYVTWGAVEGVCRVGNSNRYEVARACVRWKKGALNDANIYSMATFPPGR